MRFNLRSLQYKIIFVYSGQPATGWLVVGWKLAEVRGCPQESVDECHVRREVAPGA